MTFSVLEGLKKFNLEHNFVVKNIYEYYAKWIRERANSRSTPTGTRI